MIARRLGAVALAAAAALLAGCGFEQELTLLPNGSGKYVFRVVLGPSSKGAPALNGIDVESLLPALAGPECPFRGHAALDLRSRTDGDRRVMELTAWFVDVNEFRVVGKPDEHGERPTYLAFHHEPGEESSRLTVTNRIPTALGEGAEFLVGRLVKSPADRRKLAKAIQEGKLAELFAKLEAELEKPRYEETFHLPGRLASVDGAKRASDRTATLEIGIERFFDRLGRVRLAREKTRSFAWGPPAVTEETMRAFVEIADAPDQWLVVRARAERRRKEAATRAATKEPAR